MMNSRLKKLTPALNLDDVYKTLSSEPLMTREEFQAFYRADVNKVRGSDKVKMMSQGLRQCHGGSFYKTFLIGHSGVGKSTELTRLSFEVADLYRTIRFSAQRDLDTAGFRPFDILLIMMIRLAEEMSKPESEGGPGLEPPKGIVEDIHRWFDTEKIVVATSSGGGINASAGIKPPTSPLSWQSLLGLFAEVKGEVKYTVDRKSEVTEYRLSSLSKLISLLNRFLDESNELLRAKSNQEWLFLGEDFDKPGISNQLIESLFLNYANIFNDLKCHLIFNIPITLAYSDKATRLSFQPVCLPDTPVFDQKHLPNAEGRAAVSAILEARMSSNLFASKQKERLLVASGGNLRDLFEMALMAANSAALRDGSAGKIQEKDVTDAINEKRSQYTRKLGTSPFDAETLTYEDKAKRLVDIYHQKAGYDIPDPVLYSLLRARAVQEFNGTRWFGIHPLVVDLLRQQNKLEGTPILGGTVI